jgi:anti-anti-sigma factor
LEEEVVEFQMAGTQATGSLTIELKPAREAVVVRPAGELDLSNVEVLQSQLEELASRGLLKLVLDLGGLGFIDSTGLKLVLEWAQRSQLDGFDFSLVVPDGKVKRTFELAGLTGDRRISVVDRDSID